MVLIHTCAHKMNKSNWSLLIRYHLNKYPHMEFVDLYKLIYQGTLGPAHLGTQYSTIRTHLNSEFANLEAKNCEMIEKIAADNKYLRINLYAFKKAEGNPDSLARLVYRSCKKEPEELEKIKKRMKIVGDVIKKNSPTEQYKHYLKFYNEIEQEDFPVPHHSQQYIAEYQPAYRVISQQVYQKYFDNCFTSK